jgi:ABC-type transport system involved in cytochrome c biogenesis ATPase subunit
LLRDLTFDLSPGTLLRVEGGNGSGKSSLLRLLAGCTTPQRGTVRATARAAYLPQLARSLPALPAGRLSSLLSRGCGPVDPFLDEHRESRADRLSGGTARRLLLDAALSLPSELLILDEPSAGLDLAGSQRLAAVLRDRLTAGGAVVVADHRPLPLPADQVIDLGRTGTRSSSEVRITLAGTTTFRGQPARDGVVQLQVSPEERDAVLLEALQSGWSVLAVEPPA